MNKHKKQRSESALQNFPRGQSAAVPQVPLLLPLPYLAPAPPSHVSDVSPTSCSLHSRTPSHPDTLPGCALTCVIKSATDQVLPPPASRMADGDEEEDALAVSIEPIDEAVAPTAGRRRLRIACDTHEPFLCCCVLTSLLLCSGYHSLPSCSNLQGLHKETIDGQIRECIRHQEGCQSA